MYMCMPPTLGKKTILFFAICFYLLDAVAQENQNVFIKLVNPTKEKNTENTRQAFIIGSTCKSCSLTINGQPVKVYKSGGFAYEISLSESAQSFTLEAVSPKKKKATKKVEFTYLPPKPPVPVDSFEIASIQTFPEGNLMLMPGDKILFKVKALSGGVVTIFNRFPLYEIPAEMMGGMKGIYQGTYTVLPTDSFLTIKIPVTLSDSNGQRTTRATTNEFSVFPPYYSDVALTKGRLAHLEYGLGDDRLGGAKIGYLDSLVKLKIVGKVGSDYKIQLAKNRIAYIPDDQVTLMPKGSFAPYSLTGKWNVYGDDHHDYVQLSLSSRLPYQSAEEINPSVINVDVFGATNNTNWIAQMQNTSEIQQVDYEQVSDDIFRIKIRLKHAQHWGHQIYYQGNNLIIRIKHQPKDLSLKKLTIALDAGHGGNNTGGGGPTGASEKNLALSVTLKLQKKLMAAGANVIMTRTTEKFVDNKERILFFRDSIPDILVSIHLNSSADPIRSGGTSTHYRYIGNKNLSECINRRMLELGLRQYGVVGSFNFMLNSPIEYPNVLVETLFLSNPEEEALILDEVFQQKMADKIMQGLQDFLGETLK
jgi:N-acetylmuramoyl-L-alanine amidase